MRNETHGRAKQDIKTVVYIIKPPGGRDKAGNGSRDEREDHEKNRRSSTA
jgi:hypothetical protein